MIDTWAIGELDRVMNGNTVATWNDTRDPGGEFDYLRGLPRRTIKRLIGAGYLSPYGLMPDVAADYIAEYVSGIDSTDDAMRWYVRMAIAAIDERRMIARRERDERLINRRGFPTYYAMRNAAARSAGYKSLWHMRKELWE